MLIDEGRVIRDTYKVDRFLGEGAFAEVYRVNHKFLGRQVMKVFKSPSNSPEEVEKKLGEAIVLSRIGHPNIVRVFDAGIVETHVGHCGFFTMEYVAGGNLETFWRFHGKNFVPVADTVDIMRQVCRGLAVAHAEEPPIIHRDIKPQNILVGYDGSGFRIRVADFGLAKNVNPLSLLASAAGTLAFKPPEFLLNVDSCTTDVWSIGTTLYFLLTDRLPFDLTSTADFSSGKHWKRTLMPASRYNARVDRVLDSILCRALALKPIDRYSDANEMLSDLNEWSPPSKSENYTGGIENNASTDKNKGELGSSAQHGDSSAAEILTMALEHSQDAGRLTEAADLLEEALNKSPKLRKEYEYQLKLWRRGIVA